MTLRAIVAVARVKLLELARSPITAIVLVTFLLLVASLPDPGRAGRAERIRQASAWAISAAGALIWLTAVLVPVSGGAPAARAREGRLIGCRATNLGHGAAGFLFLVFVAGVFSIATWVWISVKFGDPDTRPEGAVVRRVVFENREPIRLSSGEEWSSGPVALGPTGGVLEVELMPKLRLLDDGDPPAAASGPSQPAIELSWRVDGGAARSRRVVVGTKRPLVEALEIGEGRPGSVAISMRFSGRDAELEAPAGSFVLLGSRVALFPVLARSLILVACVAFVLAGVAQWFSNFVGPLIAVSAALTLLLAVAVFRATSSAEWMAGVREFLPRDPVAGIRLGHETAWTDVLRGLGVAASALFLASAGAVRGSERPVS